MNKTKEAINTFVSKSGHHDTTVHESVNPAVQHETVRPSQHEEINTAVDKEVHQDHYHHTVQPIHQKEVLPEQHHHKLGKVEHRQFDHRDDSKTKRALETEAAKFKDESRRVEATHTQSHAPVVQGEHVHHHVHETYQPVVHKETVEPHVVHTTVPIHETHHNEAKHHGTSTLPAISMDEFKKHGGSHKGGQHDQHFFEGCPDVEGGAHSHNKGLQNIIGSGRTGTAGTTSSHGTSGPHDSKLANKLDPRVDSDRDHRAAGANIGSGLGSSTTTGAAGVTNSGTHDRALGSRIGNSGVSSGAAGTAAATAMGSHSHGQASTHSRKDSGHGLNDHDQAGNKPSLLEKVGEKLGLSHSNETTTSRNDGVFDSVNSKR